MAGLRIAASLRCSFPGRVPLFYYQPNGFYRAIEKLRITGAAMISMRSIFPVIQGAQFGGAGNVIAAHHRARFVDLAVK